MARFYLSCRLAIAAGIFCAASGAYGFGDKDASKALSPRQPSLGSVFPMGVTVGQRADLEILGEHLDGVSGITSDCKGLMWTISEASAIGLKVQVRASDSAVPGPCFVYAEGKRGQSNRLLFRVTAWPTVIEREPNDFQDDGGLVPVPGIIHGRLAKINDSDFFRFTASTGQRIAFSLLNARNGLNGHLALTLLDASGKEVAHNHYGFGPDPRLDHTFAEGGAFTVVVTARRSGDFFTVIGDNTTLNWQYQLAVGQSPVPRSIFPLGGKRGTSVSAELKADFLDATALPAFTGNGVSGRLESSTAGHFKMNIDIAKDAGLGEHFLSFPDPSGNTILLCFVVSDDNEVLEKEPNGKEEIAQEISPPVTINGRIAEPGDRDRFRIKVNQDDDLTFSVSARSLGSQMTDPHLAVSRAGGDLVGIADDRCQQILGREDGCPAYFGSVGRKERLDPEASHRFVSRSANDADAAGEYILHMSDMSVRGGEESGYRLTVRKRWPNFLVGITAARVSAALGSPAKVPVVVLRQEGFRGKVRLQVANLPAAWTARPLVLEGDEETGSLEILQEKSEPATASVKIVATAKIGEAEISHIARLAPHLAEDGFGYIEAPISRVPISFVAPARYTIAIEQPKGGAVFDLKKLAPVELQVTINRAEGFQAPVMIAGEALPPGISLRTSDPVAGEKSQVTLVADPSVAKPGSYRITLRGVADVAGEQIVDVSQSFRLEVRQ